MNIPATTTAPPKENIIEFWQTLYGRAEGFFTVASLDHAATEKTGWRERHFKWPDEAKAAVAHALRENGRGRSVYQSVLLFTKPGRTKEYAAPVRVLFADLDHGMPEGLLPPTILVQSSPGKFQAYWILREPIDPQRAEGLLRRLVSFVGGDEGAKDLARVLRIPGTANHKYDGTPSVEVVH